MTSQTSNRRKRFSWFKLSFVIVSHLSWCFVSDLHSLCRIRIIEWFSDFKTIKSFVKWSQNDQVFCQMFSKRASSLRSNILNFISRLKFVFRIQFVHAKTTFSCDRRYYKRRDDDRWWWSTNDATTCCFFLKAKMLSCFSFF